VPEKRAKVDPHPAWRKDAMNDPEIVYEVLSLKTTIEYHEGLCAWHAYSIDEERGHDCIPSPCVVLVRVGAKYSLKITCMLILRDNRGTWQCRLPANIENCEPDGRDEGLTSGNCTGRNNSAGVE
jgi:hypothetical protein